MVMPRESFGISFGSDQNDAPRWGVLKRELNDRNSNENLTNRIKDKENKDLIQLTKFDQMTSQIICTYSYIKIDK